MTEFCDYEFPSDDCHSIGQYVKSLVETLVASPRVLTYESLYSADDDTLTEIWGECGPPECGIVVWSNTTLEEYTVWSYTNGSWRNTGEASFASPYYTTFEGYSGPVQGWEGGWTVDGTGRVYPNLTLSGTNLVSNYSFEDWTGGTPDDFTTAFGIYSQNTTVVQDSQSSLYGVSELHIFPNYRADLLQNVAVTEGKWYQRYIYLYNVSLYAFYSYPATSVDTLHGPTSLGDYSGLRDLGWIKLTYDDIALTSNLPIYFDIQGPEQTFYFDHASLQEITSGWNINKEFYDAYGTMYVDIYKNKSYSITGLLLNYQDNDNYAMVVLSQSSPLTNVTINLVEVSSGTTTLTNSWSSAYVDGARLEVSRNSDDTVDIDYNGVNKVTGQALASPIAATKHGIICTSSSDYFTAFGFTPE